MMRVMHVMVVVVYPRVPRELVRAREALLAARERALERLLACVGAYVAGLRDQNQIKIFHVGIDKGTGERKRVRTWVRDRSG